MKGPDGISRRGLFSLRVPLWGMVGATVTAGCSGVMLERVRPRLAGCRGKLAEGQHVRATPDRLIARLCVGVRESTRSGGAGRGWAGSSGSAGRAGGRSG